MIRPDDLLNNVRVASPCRQSWSSMEGDDRVRFCSACTLHVYNLSGMTRAEVRNLILKSEGRLCVRYYRRSDGTLLTADCPLGMRAVRKRIGFAFSCAFVLAASLVGFALRQSRPGLSEQLQELRTNPFGWRARQPDPVRETLDRIDPPAPDYSSYATVGALASPISPSPSGDAGQ